MDTHCKPNFMFLGRTLFEKNAIITSKIQSYTIVLINNFEILQISIAFFSDTVRPRNLKFFCILTHMDTLCKSNIEIWFKTTKKHFRILFSYLQFTYKSEMAMLKKWSKSEIS